MSQSNNGLEINIPALVELYQSNPKVAEQLRTALIEYTIGSAPTALQQRLRGLQFQVDMQRRRSSSTLGSAKRVSTMMLDSFVLLQTHLHEFLERLKGKTNTAEKTVTKDNTHHAAKILVLQPREKTSGS